jgi:hypothetical protein
MKMNNIREIRKLLDDFQYVKLMPARRDVSSIKTTSEEFETFLIECFEAWDEKNKTLYKKAVILRSSDITSDEGSPKITEIAKDLQTLIEVLRILKQSIGPVTFEKVREDLTKKVSDTIDTYTTLFQIAVGDFPYDVDFTEKVVRNVKLQSTMGKWGNSSVKSSIHQSATKHLPGAKEYTYKKKGSVSRALLDINKHLWVLLRILYLILFYGFIQTEIARSLLPYDLWINTLLWLLLFIWIIRAIRKRKITILLSGLIIWGVPLLWTYGVVSVDSFEIESVRRVLKIILWLTVIFWFPLQFLNIIKDYRVSQIIILTVIWAGVLSLFSYGILKGLLVATLLLIVPISRLLNAPKSRHTNLPGNFDKQLYIPTSFSLLFVALFVTHEGLWLIGAVIWIMFSITASHSYRYFRRTYDLIEDLYPKPQGKRRRHLLLFISLSLVTLLLFPGLLGKLSGEYVIGLYSQATGFAFGLITILLAVQAIIPGVTTWAGDTRKANHLREMRSILRANAGLEGFMQWFFILFVFSLAAWFVSTRFLGNLSHLVDLSFVNAFEQPINVLREIKDIFSANQGISEEAITRFSTLIFAVFVYVTIYGIAQLYYLFIAANTLTLPIRDSILSNPVEIESIDFENIDNTEQDTIFEGIKDKLRSNLDLNGQIINQLNVNYEPDNPNRIKKVRAEFEQDFIELDELMEFINKAFSGLFQLDRHADVEVVIVRRTYQRFRRQPVFALEVNNSEWEFLKKDLPGFPFDYRLKCLGARLSDYVMAESQIA